MTWHPYALFWNFWNCSDVSEAQRLQSDALEYNFFVQRQPHTPSYFKFIFFVKRQLGFLVLL